MIKVGVQAAAGEKVLRCLVLDFLAGETWLGTASRLPGLLGKWLLSAGSAGVFGTRVRNQRSSHG